MNRPRLGSLATVSRLGGILGLFILSLLSLGGLLYAIGSASWKSPILAAAIGLLLLWMAFGFRRIRRAERAEIARFQRRPRLEDLRFLDEIEIDPSLPQAEIALGARRAFADLGSVPAESIKASDRFYPDLEKLPFYDSIDALGVILELETKVGVQICGDDAERLLNKIIHRESATVGEVTLDVVRIWSKQRALESPR